MSNTISSTTPLHQSYSQPAPARQQPKPKAEEPQDTVTLSHHAKVASDPDHNGH